MRSGRSARCSPSTAPGRSSALSPSTPGGTTSRAEPTENSHGTDTLVAPRNATRRRRRYPGGRCPDGAGLWDARPLPNWPLYANRPTRSAFKDLAPESAAACGDQMVDLARSFLGGTGRATTWQRCALVGPDRTRGRSCGTTSEPGSSAGQNAGLAAWPGRHAEPDPGHAPGGAERRGPPRADRRQPGQPGRAAARPPTPGRGVDAGPR